MVTPWVNPFPHTTILQQTTLNVFCQKIEIEWITYDKKWKTLWQKVLLLSLCFQKAICCRGVRKRLNEGKGYDM